MAASFIFDPSKGETPETVATRRKTADAIAARIFGRAPQNVGEGLNALGQAWIARSMKTEADDAQKAGMAYGNDAMSKLVAAMTGGRTPLDPAGQGASPPPTSEPSSQPSVATPMGGTSIPAGKEAFIASLMPMAQETAARTGLDPRLIVAQAALESGWGRSAPGNNLFGIKSHGRAGGNVLPTTEVVGGQPVQIRDSFRAYASPADSVKDHADFLTSNPRYKPLLEAQGLDAQIAALGKSGYATDPAYGQKVGQIARSLPMPGGAPATTPQASTAQPQSDGLSLAELAQYANNSWLMANEGRRGIVNMLIKQKLEQQQRMADPAYQLDIAKKRRDLEKSDEPTSVQEYEYYKKNLLPEQKPMDYATWSTAKARASATNVTTNVGGEKAWDQESAKLFARRYDDIAKGAMNAQTMMSMYDIAEQALTGGVRTGFGAETELNLRQMAQSLGIEGADNPEKVAGGELIRSIQNRMALLMRSPDGGMGMPGALSDRDIKFLKDSQVGLDRSPEGNRRMLAAYRAMEQRKIDIARLADEYVQENGRLDAGFNRRVREYAAANPVFPDAPANTGKSNVDDLLKKYGGAQ